MTPDELHELWVEAGRPVCAGMCSAEGETVISVPSPGREVCVFRSDEERILFCSLPGFDWRPDFAAPTTEPLLMYLAEEAVGEPLTWVCRELSHEAEMTEFSVRIGGGEEYAATRSELALRIIIAAQAKRDGAA